MSENQGFAARLRRLMHQKGLLLKDIAAATGRSIAAAHKWTRGGEIEYGNLRALAARLEVNWIWLRYGEDAMQELAAEAGLLPDHHRRKPEAAWLINEALLRQGLQHASAIAWEWDALSGKITSSVNTEAVLGRSVTTLDDVLQCIHPDDRAGMQAGIDNLLVTESLFETHHRILLPDGRIHWLAHRCQRVADMRGHAVKVSGTGVDITGRLLAEEALRESRQQLTLALSLAQQNIWELDLRTWDWTPVRSDPSAAPDALPCSMLPTTFRDFIAHVHPDDRAQVVMSLRAAQMTGEEEGMEFRIETPDGGIRWYKSRLRSLPGEAGRTTRIIGVTTETTGQKKLEQRLDRKRRRLEMALEAAGLGEWELDLETREMTCSDATAAMLGLHSAAELRSEADFLRLLHPDDRQKMRNILDAAMAGAGRYQTTYRVRLSDGRLRHIREHAILSRNLAGHYDKCFGAIAMA